MTDPEQTALAAFADTDDTIEDGAGEEDLADLRDDVDRLTELVGMLADSYGDLAETVETATLEDGDDRDDRLDGGRTPDRGFE